MFFLVTFNHCFFAAASIEIQLVFAPKKDLFKLTGQKKGLPAYVLNIINQPVLLKKNQNLISDPINLMNKLEKDFGLKPSSLNACQFFALNKKFEKVLIIKIPSALKITVTKRINSSGLSLKKISQNILLQKSLTLSLALKQFELDDEFTKKLNLALNFYKTIEKNPAIAAKTIKSIRSKKRTSNKIDRKRGLKPKQT